MNEIAHFILEWRHFIGLILYVSFILIFAWDTKPDAVSATARSNAIFSRFIQRQQTND